MNAGILYVLLSVFTYSLYAISLKPFKKRIILFFWVNIFAYLAYLTLYFIKNIILDHDLHPIQHLLHDFTFTNIPLYLIMACAWVGSIIILNHLLDKYDVSLVMPVTEISILFTTLGYLALGTTFAWKSIISVLIVFVGAIVSAFDKLSLKDPLAPLRKIPAELLIGGTLESFLTSTSKWVTFICTHQTAVTLGLHEWMNNVFIHIYHTPFSFRNPFYYNVGVRFFIAMIFLIYIGFVKKTHASIIPVLKEHWRYIILASTAFSVSIMSFHTAFFMLEDKNILTALSKLSIPVILIIGNIFLKEKITAPKIAGCAIIVAGGLMGLLL